MPCSAAMSEKLRTVLETETVEDVLRTMREQDIKAVCVLDEEDNFTGLFSYAAFLKHLLPVTVPTSQSSSMDMKIGAAPGIAKRLKKSLPLPVQTFVERKVSAVSPDTPIWEGVNKLLQSGEPLVVMDPESGRVTGMITAQSIFEELERMKD